MKTAIMGIVGLGNCVPLSEVVKDQEAIEDYDEELGCAVWFDYDPASGIVYTYDTGNVEVGSEFELL